MTGILAGLLLLCVLVVVHELGHFLFAKALGVKVLTFSVGFGPRLFGFTRNGTEYKFSAILLGGYIRMFGESLEEKVSDEEKKYSFLHQPVWKKSLIAFAGPLFNFILPIVLFFFIFFGSEQVLKPVVGTVIRGQPAFSGGLQEGDQILSIDHKPVKTFHDLVELVSANPKKSLLFQVKREVQPGNMQDVYLSIVPDSEINPHPLYKDKPVGRIGVMPVSQKPIIIVTHPESLAAKAGLQSFDEVTELDGKKVTSAASFFKVLAQNPTKDFSLKINRIGKGGTKVSKQIVLPHAGVSGWKFNREKKLRRYAVTEEELQTERFRKRIITNRALELQMAVLDKRQRGLSFADASIAGVEEESSASSLDLKKGDRLVAVDGEPVSTWVEIYQIFDKEPDDFHVASIVSNGKILTTVFRLKPKENTDSKFGPPPQKVFGQKIVQVYGEGPTFERPVGVVAALSKAATKTWELVYLTVKSLWMLISFQLPVSQLGGPIMLIGVAGQAVEQGLAFYVYVMSLISINLGLLNLLPIPVLDGGHLLMFGIEAVQRKPISMKTRQVATQIGLIFILMLTAIALFNDFSRIFSN